MGTFIDENLIPGEQIVYKAEVHWLVYFPAMFNVLLAVLLFLFSKFVMHSHSYLTLLSLVPLLVAAYKAVQAYLHCHYTEIVITDKRLIAKFGFIRREMIELPLEKIESVIVEQTVMDRLIDAGSVGARGTGMAMAPVRYIDSPVGFRNALNEAISRAKSTT